MQPERCFTECSMVHFGYVEYESEFQSSYYRMQHGALTEVSPSHWAAYLLYKEDQGSPQYALIVLQPVRKTHRDMFHQEEGVDGHTKR